MTNGRRTRAWVVALALAVAIGGCSIGSSGPSGQAGDPTSRPVLADGPNTLRVLAGSEVKDMLPLLKAAQAATGVRVELEYAGTLEGAEQVAAGAADGRYDAIWFSSNRYLALLP